MRRAAAALLSVATRVPSHVVLEAKRPAAAAAVTAAAGLPQATRTASGSFWQRGLHPQATRSVWQDSSGLQHFENRTSWWAGRTAWLAGGTAVAFGVYYVSCLETVPYTGRRHSIMFVSRNQEKALGQMVFDAQREEARQEHKLLPDSHPAALLVRRVGMRVAAVASEEGNGDGSKRGNTQHMKGLDWDFAVVQSATPNAFVVPGGKVVVFTGLLNLLSSEDELAAVLAHETSHVLARHHAERMSTLNLFALTRLLFYLAFGLSIPQSLLLLGVFLPYSRRAEHEADAIGLRVMAKACYDPAACPSMLVKLHAKEQQMKGVNVPALLRTHPPTDERVQLVRQQLPEARLLYDARCGAVQAAFGNQLLGL